MAAQFDRETHVNHRVIRARIPILAAEIEALLVSKEDAGLYGGNATQGEIADACISWVVNNIYGAPSEEDNDG